MINKINVRHIPYYRWTAEQVIYAIRERVKQKLRLNHTTVKQEEQTLVRAAYLIFGSWRKALEAAKIKPSQFGFKPYERWSREKIIKALREWYSAHPIPPPINSKAEKRRLRLHIIARRYFLNNRQVIEAIGADLIWRRPYHTLWNSEKVIKSIQARVRDKKPLKSAIVLKENQSLYRAARTYFGSYQKALKAASSGNAIPNVPGLQ